MLHAAMELVFFSTKFLIVLVLLLLFLAGILALLSRSRNRTEGLLQVTCLNDRYTTYEETLLADILPKKAFRQHQKQQRKQNKDRLSAHDSPTLFVLRFLGDIRASAVCALREEITAILKVATPRDEVLVCLESAGGMVHAYGLATAQLQRLRNRRIPLTVIVDKVAASGGYMMACVANQLIAAPFAIIGSIGVILQLPNFNRLLKKQDVDFEQITAGRYKRTLTIFGQNTEEGRAKSREEIEAIHILFQNLVKAHRPDIDLDRVTTGEHWSGEDALPLRLIDALGTSDDWLLEKNATMRLLEIRYHPPRSFMEKLSGAKHRLLTAFHQDSLPW